MAAIVAPAEADVTRFDLPRDQERDAGFARGMAFGMADYEKAVSEKKRALFDRLWQGLPNGGTVVEVGMGSFPNAEYFSLQSTPRGLDIVGVDPNDSMEAFARENAQRFGVLKKRKGNSLRIVHGVAEALPLGSGTADAVVCTLTLCSVLDPQRALAEIRRVLKPGGRFLFSEHVLSETDEDFAEEQRKMSPYQVVRADGCHLDRRTLETIRGAGFKEVDGEYFELKDFGYLDPTVAGLATA